MSRLSLHTLAWSEERQCYELYTQERLQCCFAPGDERAWLDWLVDCASFSFRGRYGRASVVKEERARGAGYWYAYSTRGRRTGKRYLGPTSKMTFAHIETVTQALTGNAMPASDPSNNAGQPTAIPSLPVSPFLATKLSPPRLPTVLVEREHLRDRLEDALTRPLLLLSASAGWGKTTLLSAWVAHTTHTVAWMTLDGGDNDPARFWGAVIASLRSHLLGVGASALAMLHTPQPPRLAVILSTLLTELSLLKRKILIILDNYHLITEQAIHESLLYFLEHMPEPLSLVLASRVDPPFPLARLRVQGRMSELRDMDLRFQESDVARFLVRDQGLPLSDDEVLALTKRTEGWIAGLQLAALTLHQRKDHAAFVRNFAGSHRYLLDYLQEEVLDHQPSTLQTFLLRASVLSRLNASLCEAVTGEAASQEMLDIIERSNLFLIALDDERDWYRFHDLFREMLLTRLKTSQPELVPRLHTRASRWYEARGELTEALTHALAAADFSSAATLMERAAEQTWMMGSAQIVLGWVAQLPDDVLLNHLDLALTAALHMLHKLFGAPEEHNAEVLAQVEETIARAEHLLHDDQRETLSPEERTLLTTRVRTFYLWPQANRAIQDGDVARLSQHCQRMQELAQEEKDILWQMAPLFLNVVFYLNALTNSDTLLPHLHQTRHQSERAMKAYEYLRLGQWLAQISYESGQLRESHRLCLETLSLLKHEGIQALSMYGYVRLTLAQLCWSWGREEVAYDHLDAAREHAHIGQYSALNLDAQTLRLQFLLDAGNATEADRVLHDIECLIRKQVTGLYIPGVASARVRLWLIQGNMHSASAWAKHHAFTLDVTASQLNWEEGLALVRVYLAQRRYEESLRILSALLSSAEDGARYRKLARALAWQVVALEGAGKIEEAMQATTRLLDLTRPEGNVRAYLDVGELIRSILLRLLEPGGGHALSHANFTFASTLLAAFEHGQSQHTTLQDQLPYDPLSPQELRVLRLLVEGQTYIEIAQALIVSHNTVKTQVSSIYRKLNVSRRAEAIRAAQRLQLL